MEEITLNDGRKVTKRKVKVRDLANAEAQAKGKDHLIKYAIMGAKILINDKPAVLEDILDMDEDDLVKVGELFEDDIPNV
jgi:hypothetical protein